ncbi:plasmid pRiA4b ORF-3 family protein [Amycolatopsis sacchari]|uniref:plasmid pRiA4b ORF-3 family protein n=1 Tax=Amycolatopsis sacchari TaxID=115433 RepID=UPI001FE799F2|nr:plasmid pRiA4b ORF-3 family protein [Amycolatopsis sacchari]
MLKPAQLPSAAAALGVRLPAKVRTAAEVPTVHWPWLAAEAAGLIEIGPAKAVAREPEGDPAELWLKGLDAVLTAESHDPERRGARTLCRAVLAAAEGGDVAEILAGYEDAAAAYKAFRQTGDLPVEDAVALLTSFGALDGGRLTDLGRWARDRFEARAPESVTPELSAGELLTRLAPLPEDETWELALRWFGDRRPVFGAAQLLHAADFATPVERVAAVDVVAGFGAEVLSAWRSALRYRNLRAHAMAALASWGEGRGVDELQRRWLVTEYALATRVRRGLENAFHYVRDSGGLGVLAASDHPDAAGLHDALVKANFRVRVHQLKVEAGTGEWWRVQVPAGTTLGALHEVLLPLAGHDGTELHEFTVDGVRYADPRSGLPGRRDEHELRLSTVFPRRGGELHYAYDLAGPWTYRITCEKVLDPDPACTYPLVVADGVTR